MFSVKMAAENAKSALTDNGLAENDMDSEIGENSFAVLNYRPLFITIDAKG